MLKAMHELMRNHTRNFVSDTVLGDFGDVFQTEVDLFVVVVQVAAGGVGDAGHVAEDEGDGACGRGGGRGVGGGVVEELEDGEGG